MESKQAEYLQLLQERNRLKRQMQSKSKHELELEARERGFSAHFSGANNDRAASSADDLKKPIVQTNVKSIITPKYGNPSSAATAGSSAPQQSSPRALVDKTSQRSSSASSAPRTRGWASKPPEQLFGIPIAISPKSDNASELSTPTSVFAEMQHHQQLPARSPTTAQASIVKNNKFKSQLDNILKKSIPSSSTSSTVGHASSTSKQPRPAAVESKQHQSIKSQVENKPTASASKQSSPRSPHSAAMSTSSASASSRRDISPIVILPMKQDEEHGQGFAVNDELDDHELEYSDHGSLDQDQNLDDHDDGEDLVNQDNEDDESAYVDDFEKLSDEEWSDSVRVWKEQTKIKAETWKELRALSPKKKKHPEGFDKKDGAGGSSSLASSIDSTSSSSSKKLSAILDKTYQSHQLTRKSLRYSNANKQSKQASKSSSAASSSSYQQDIQTLTDMISGKSIDMDQSLIRKLMSLDPQQKAIILAALQPAAFASPADTSKKANDQADQAEEEDVIYEDEVALNIRIKIMSTWGKSKAGSLSCILLRAVHPQSSESSDSSKPKPVINYLNHLQGRVLSGIEYLPPSSEAMRMLPQIILSTMPNQKMFPSDPKNVWKAPLSSDHPIEIAFQGNISIRGDETSVPITEETTADDLLDGLELILVNGYGACSCKDVDVYVGYRCVWSGEMPDTSMYSNDRYTASSTTLRLPVLISEAIEKEQWTKRIMGLGRKNFIQRKKSNSNPPLPQHLQPMAISNSDTTIAVSSAHPRARNASSTTSSAVGDDTPAEPVDDVTATRSNMPIWLDAPPNTFNVADESMNVTGTKKPPIWLAGTGKHRDRSSSNTDDKTSTTTHSPSKLPNDASPITGNPSRRRRTTLSKQESLSPDLPSSSNTNDSAIAQRNRSRAQDRKLEEERLRQSLEALTIADRSNLGRLHATPLLEISSSSTAAATTSIAEINQTDSPSMPVSAMPTNVLRRRARRIQEVTKTVQTTVQNLAQVFNTNIVLHGQSSTEAQSEHISNAATASPSIVEQRGESLSSSLNSNNLNNSGLLSILSAVLPKGRVLTMEIYSTWGDEFYVGLNGFDLFDSHGQYIDSASQQILSIVANPPDINILPDYHNDPRVAANLIDGLNFTKNDLHMWLAPVGYYKAHPSHQQVTSSSRFMNRQPIASITINFHTAIALSMIRVFNYNKSRTHIQRGVRECRMLLDGKYIYEG
jgi:hypothetical protein